MTATARRALIGFLSAVGVLVIVGLVLLWPSGDAKPGAEASTRFAGPGVTFLPADVTQVMPLCSEGQQPSPTSPSCGAIVVDLDGKALPILVNPEVTDSGLAVGDTVTLVRSPSPDGSPATYNYFQTQREVPLLVMAALFVAIVALVARRRGLLALVGVGVGGAVLFRFMLPALLAGSNGVAVAITGSSAIMFVVLYLAHGVSIRTSTALAGTLIGVAFTTTFGMLGVHGARLTGIADDDGAMLTAVARSLDPHDLLYCGIIVAGLGVLNDVTITQSSAVWELRAASPGMSRNDLFLSGMRIGRDHIASTIYTIVFAYAGAALPVLLLMSVFDRPALELLQSEGISQELVSTLASATGLVLAVPITTALATWTVADTATAPGAKSVTETP